MSQVLRALGTAVAGCMIIATTACTTHTTASDANVTTTATQQQAAGGGSTTPHTANPFDSLYPADFRLQPLGKVTAAAAQPPAKATGLTDGITDATHHTLVFRATAGADTAPHSTRIRHEYSRRQAFNADSSHYLAQNNRGEWYLYDAVTFENLGRIPQLTGDAEPLWHPHDPNILWHTARNGGTSWMSLDVSTGAEQKLLDLSELSPWPQATAYWTGGEGSASADGGILTLMATSYDSQAQRVTVHGVLTVDVKQQKLVGSLAAASFPTPHAVPDHVSTAPSGKYAVVSWLAEHGGTVAYSTDFKETQQLTQSSEHSDLALGPAQEDFFVYSDYQAGAITARNITSGESFSIRSLYPAPGEAYAVHISGQAFGRPGWVLISTYAATRDYGAAAAPDNSQAEYGRIWLAELQANGQQLTVANTMVDHTKVPETEAYFAEPQASISRDGSRIIFASNYGGAEINSYIIGLPSSVYSR